MYIVDAACSALLLAALYGIGPVGYWHPIFSTFTIMKTLVALIPPMATFVLAEAIAEGPRSSRQRGSGEESAETPTQRTVGLKRRNENAQRH
jgi:hypothetical protein